MRRLWDVLAGLILTAIALNLLFELLRPHAVFIALAAAVLLISKIIYRRYSNW